MLFDMQNILADDQAVTVTAVGETVIDLGADRDIGKGVPVPLLIQVSEEDFAAAGAGTLTVDLQTDDNEAMASPEVIWTSGAIGKADLVAGYKFNINYVPRTNQRYLRLNFTVATGPMTAGKITAGISGEQQDSFSG